MLWSSLSKIQNTFPHETVAFIANDLVSEQRNSKAYGRIKARPLTKPSGGRMDHYGSKVNFKFVYVPQPRAGPSRQVRHVLAAAGVPTSSRQNLQTLFKLRLMVAVILV